jgi:predicted metal-dependent enzyme (double-stranded beta helix superfamily)
VSPIHPALAALAGAAKKKSWTELEDCLRAAVRAPAWLRPEHRVGDPNAYMRHLLYVDPDGGFVMTAITWLPGQMSPVHGHRVWCAFGVAEGELTEEQFDAGLRLSGARNLSPGQTAGQDLHGETIHRVANRGRIPLVSLHLYGVSAERLTTGINRIYG